MLQRHGEPKSSAAPYLGEPGQKQATLQGGPFFLPSLGRKRRESTSWQALKAGGLGAAWSRWEGLIQVGGVERVPSRGGQGGAQKRRELSRVSQTEIRLCNPRPLGH